jgi:hypothetical protein
MILSWIFLFKISERLDIIRILNIFKINIYVENNIYNYKKSYAFSRF